MPNSPRARLKPSATERSSVTSISTKAAVPPRCSISATAAFPPLELISVITTRAPSAAKSAAEARPMPDTPR